MRPGESQRVNSGQRSWGGVSAVIGMFVILLAVLCGLMASFAQRPEPTPMAVSSPLPTATRRPTPRPIPTALYGGCDVIEAYVVAQQAVRQRLKSPATAQFPCCYEDFTRTLSGTCHYEVTAYVDSENSFGALLRTQFRLVIRKTSDDYWQLEEIEFY